MNFIMFSLQNLNFSFKSFPSRNRERIRGQVLHCHICHLSITFLMFQWLSLSYSEPSSQSSSLFFLSPSVEASFPVTIRGYSIIFSSLFQSGFVRGESIKIPPNLPLRKGGIIKGGNGRGGKRRPEKLS